ncbi:MAG: LysM peptidoglycan-binding domain-containing protein [Gemmatimonas sp.]
MTESAETQGNVSAQLPDSRPVHRVVPARRQRSAIRRILAALTRSSALLAVSGLVAAATMVPPIGARRSARLAAEQELRSLLASDEVVVASTFASQRRWTDVWRESFGIVAATSRRILYVGAPPTPLLRPREDGPMELLVESYPYERSFVIEPRDVFFGQLRGLALRTPLARVDFLISSGEWVAAQAVAKAALTSQQKLTIEAENQERFNRAPAPEAEVYVPYVVKRGETLTGLARRLHTTADVLRQLNQLRDDNIKTGQRIRVPRGTMVDSTNTPPDSSRSSVGHS